MPYYTDLSFLAGQPIIDESNYQQFVKPQSDDGCSITGYKPRQTPFGQLKSARALPANKILTRQEIKEAIEEQDRTETSLWHILKRGPKIWRNQSPSNYCWFYATMHAMQAARVIANLPPVLLSPLSGGCPCDGFRNQGGMGEDALEWLVAHGVCEEKYWPSDNVTRSGGINRKYYTEEAKANALNYRVIEWDDLPSRDFLAKASQVVRHIPVSSGYNFMGHQMCTVRIIINPNGSFSCIDLDSYGHGGDFSQQVLSESRGAADDMCSPRIAT